MHNSFTILDWSVFAIYFAMLAGIGWFFSQKRSKNTQEYFLGGNKMPLWVVAVSVLATSQSAATFLGGPDQGYRSDFSYLATNIGAFIAAVFVSRYLIPQFYKYKVTTVYELLETRFGETAKRQAGVMYLLGRVFASGARLYMAAIAVSMILFYDIAPEHVVSSILLLTVIGLGYSVIGGIRSVIYSDALQCAVYVLAAIAVIAILLTTIPADLSQIFATLNSPGIDMASKLTVLNFELDFTAGGVFSFWSAITGFVLLNIAAFGLDQDMTQRVLTCKNEKEGAKAIIWSVVMVIPVMAIFIFIGALLFLFYQHPEIMNQGQDGPISQTFSGEKITIFMYYILNELPAGLRGLVTVGVIAAALSTLNSGLNSMSSVLIQDLYRPWLAKRSTEQSELHFVKAGQIGMLLGAGALAGMAVLCFYWQQYSDMPLLAFALSVMVFSYSGLLGVYFTAIFTQRGSSYSVLLALITGFSVTLLFQPYIWELLMPASWQGLNLGFTWQLCIGTLCSFLVCSCWPSGARHEDSLERVSPSASA